MNLAEFLEARIAEDETKTRALVCRAHETELTLKELRFLGTEQPGWFDWPKVEAMCRLRLAECAAKRRIIRRCDFLLKAWDQKGNGPYPDMTRRERSTAAGTLRDLAGPYADHPDFQEEWRP